MESARPRAVREAARGRAGSSALASSAFFSTCRAFANQNAPIKVLPFQGSYALTTSIFDYFPRISCKRVCCSFVGSGAGIPYCRRANRLHFGRTGAEEETAGRQPDKDRYGMRGIGLVGEQIRRSQWSGGH